MKLRIGPNTTKDSACMNVILNSNYSTNFSLGTCDNFLPFIPEPRFLNVYLQAGTCISEDMLARHVQKE